jgi:hypothetical protein
MGRGLDERLKRARLYRVIEQKHRAEVVARLIALLEMTERLEFSLRMRLMAQEAKEAQTEIDARHACDTVRPPRFA